MNTYTTVDEYIANFPEEVQVKLKQIRESIKEIVPQAEEKISYGIPTATLNGKYFIYFAGYKNHVSIYPITEAVETSAKAILKYRTGKGTLQFSLDETLPMSLIRKVITVRAKEHLATLQKK